MPKKDVPQMEQSWFYCFSFVMFVMPKTTQPLLAINQSGSPAASQSLVHSLIRSPS